MFVVLPVYQLASVGSRIFERGALFWKSIGAGSKGPRGHVPPRFFEEGAAGGHNVMKKINVLRPQYY